MKITGERMTLAIIAVIAVLMLISCSSGSQQAPGTGSGDLSGYLETRIMGQQDLIAGAPASLRILVFDSRGLKPLKEAQVKGTLTRQGNQKETSLFSEKTDSHGTLSLSYMVPQDARGSGKIEIEVKSGDTRRKEELTVNIREKTPRVSLSTDKPLYQPGQTMHIKMLALQSPTLEPLAKEKTVIEVTDPRGNKVMKSEGETSEYGIASLDFLLAQEVNCGEYTITTSGHWGSSSKKVIVKKYVLPKFKATLEAGKKFCQPGETIDGVVNARYFFGKPVSGAEVVVNVITSDVRMEKAATLKGITDKDGFYKFSYRVPVGFSGRAFRENRAFVQFEASIIDSTKHKEVVLHRYPVAMTPITIQALPEGGRLIAGIENDLYLLTSYPDGSPAECELTIRLDGGKSRDITTDSTGYGVLPCTPKPGENSNFSIDAKDKKGNHSQKTVAFAVPDKEEAILLRTNKSLYTGSDPIKVKVSSTLKEGTAYLDFIRDGQIVYTRSLSLNEGKGDTELDIPKNLAGVVTLNAYYFSPYAGMVGDSRMFYVSGSDLEVSVKLNKGSYRPGEEAQLEFKVTDREGKPVPSALGIDIVDESVFALFDRKPGTEKIFFTVPGTYLKAPYMIQGLGLGDFITAPGETKSDIFSRVALAQAPQAPPYTINMDSYAEKERKIAADMEMIKNAAIAFNSKNQKWPSKVSVLVAANLITPMVSRDPWGREYVIKPPAGSDIMKKTQPQYFNKYIDEERMPQIDASVRRRGMPLMDNVAPVAPYRQALVWSGGWPDVLCLGADGREGTADDFDLKIYIVNRGPQMPPVPPTVASRRNYDDSESRNMPSAYKAQGAMNASKDKEMASESKMEATRASDLPVAKQAGLDSGAEPVKVREFFPETLLSRPELITDDKGKALLTVPLADSVTTWRMMALANSKNGQLGNTTAGVKVFQDFFIDLDLPVTLTQGDEISIPVALYNYLPKAQDIQLTLDSAPWFDRMDGSGTQKKTVQKEDVAVTHFRIKAKEVGMHKLTLTARGTALSDALSRSIEVVPDGKKYMLYKGDLIQSPGASTQVEIPGNAIAGASNIQLTLYPKPLSQAVQGMDAMLAMPNGCFEQTSSTLYPDIVILDYLRKSKQSRPDIEKRAQSYINQGCQRLATFERRPGGGFDYYGQAGASPVLSAYGLMIFSDASKVAQVDTAIIDRTRKAILSCRKGDGSWGTESQFARGGVFGITAYITWTMAEAGCKSEIASSIDYLKRNYGQVEDHYALALCANAFIDMNPQDSDAQKIIAKLASLKKEGDKGETVFWNGSSLYTHGPASSIDTTALVAIAMMKSNMHTQLTTKALKFIVRSKGAGGLWQSTQSTAMALRALGLSSTGGGIDAEGTMDIYVNGTKADSIKVGAADRELFQQLDLKKYVVKGTNTIKIDLNGKGSCAYQVTGTYYLPWSGAELARKKELDIQVAFNKKEVRTMENIQCNVKVKNLKSTSATQVMVVVGTPPGFDVMAEDIEKLVAGKNIQKFESYKGKVVLYLNGIDGGKSFNATYRLLAKYPIKAKTPASLTYLYYDPEINAECIPVTLSVM
jgi:alpha-2-macroglobulin-like protein